MYCILYSNLSVLGLQEGVVEGDLLVSSLSCWCPHYYPYRYHMSLAPQLILFPILQCNPRHIVSHGIMFVIVLFIHIIQRFQLELLTHVSLCSRQPSCPFELFPPRRTSLSNHPAPLSQLILPYCFPHLSLTSYRTPDHSRPVFLC